MEYIHSKNLYITYLLRNCAAPTTYGTWSFSVQSSRPFKLIFSHLNSVNIITCQFFNKHFNNILPSKPRSSRWSLSLLKVSPTKTEYALLFFPYVLHTPTNPIFHNLIMQEGWKTVPNSLEWSNQGQDGPLHSTKSGKFLDYLGNYWHLKSECDSWTLILMSQQ